jgi:hypothetical protein
MLRFFKTKGNHLSPCQNAVENCLPKGTEKVDYFSVNYSKILILK